MMWLKRISAAVLTLWKTHYRLRFRKKGYIFLRGEGVEVGALYLPAPVPKECKVLYCDLLTKQEALQKFPELAAYRLVEVGHWVNLDSCGLNQFNADQFSFVIMNHVLEHVANPIKVLDDALKIVRPGGHLVLAIPDKDYSIDRPRDITPFEHLIAEFRAGVTEVSDDHYMDFILKVRPELASHGAGSTEEALREVRARREHAHVWDSRAFRSFLERTFLEVLKVPVETIYESTGKQNGQEYFSVWKKLPGILP